MSKLENVVQKYYCLYLKKTVLIFNSAVQSTVTLESAVLCDLPSKLVSYDENQLATKNVTKPTALREGQLQE